MSGTIRQGYDFIIASAELDVLARRNFPEGSSEREFLLALSKSLTEVHFLNHYLKRVHDHIDRVHALNVPDEQAVLRLSIRLADISETLVTWTHHDAARTAKQSSDLLRVWYDLYLSLHMLMDASKELRAIGMDIAGRA